MSALVFQCPKTGRPIDTGLDIAVHSGIQNIQPITLRVLCPLCGNHHVWKIADGWLREPQPHQRTGAWREL